jgi:hypothetical protein
VTNSALGAPKNLAEEFNRVELVDDFWAQHRDRPMTRFFIYLCTRN